MSYVNVKLNKRQKEVIQNLIEKSRSAGTNDDVTLSMSEFRFLIEAVIPTASFDFDNDEQIIIYSGLKLSEETKNNAALNQQMLVLI